MMGGSSGATVFFGWSSYVLLMILIILGIAAHLKYLKS
jgi:hypothetical protein